MPLSPRLYHWFVRPRWLTKKYIHDHISSYVPLDNKNVLDFGSGTGANCCMCDPNLYLGVDPDADRVDLAKRLYPNHTFMTFAADEKRIPAQNDSIDFIFVVAVLHHIPDHHIRDYLLEFERVLRPGGKVIVMEPCLYGHTKFKNRFMQWYDDGEYIRSEDGYLDLFEAGRYDCQILKKFTKCFVYNEIFFSATPKMNQHFS